MVSVAGSTTLSQKVSRPSTDCESPSCGTAITFNPRAAAAARLIVAKWTAGTENVTKIGSTCTTVINWVVLAATRLPGLTARSPVRPSIGERTTVYPSCTFAASTADC